jgi:pilus assembly protein CpaF
VSFEVILPYLRPIEALILDPDVSEIMVNGSGRIFAERGGVIQHQPDLAIAERALQTGVRNIARQLGDDISEEKPLLDSRLPDGSRVAAVFPPCSVGGTTLTIRKFDNRRFTLDELVRTGSLPGSFHTTLLGAVENRQNVLISGGAGTGKTTLLNALASRIPAADRIVLIEDTAEIFIDKPDVVRLEARREQPGVPAVMIRDLLRQTLRLRPDRIIVGEVRGAEAFDLLQALNTGHSGTLSTIHANDARLALSRFTTCVLQAGVDLPYPAIRANIAEVLNLVVHLERKTDGTRRVAQILRIERYDHGRDAYESAAL